MKRLTPNSFYLAPDNEEYQVRGRRLDTDLLFHADRGLVAGPAFEVQADGQILKWPTLEPTGWTVDDLKLIG